MLDWTWKGFDVVGTLRYIDGFHEQDANLNDHYVDTDGCSIFKPLTISAPLFPHRPPRVRATPRTTRTRPVLHLPLRPR